MELFTIKMGAEIFDAHHAYGLALVVGHLADSPVCLYDHGAFYRLDLPEGRWMRKPRNPLARILALPSPRQVKVYLTDGDDPAPTPIVILDGLLSVSFTTSHLIRAASVWDLVDRDGVNPDKLTAALAKAQVSVQNICRVAERNGMGSTGWFERLLRPYRSDSLQAPIPAPSRPGSARGDVSVPMTIDPWFSHSPRPVLSAGYLPRGTNLTVRGTLDASWLVQVSAAYFQRAQRVGGKLVNYYTPLMENSVLHPDMVLEPLRFIDLNPSRALVLHALHLLSRAPAGMRRHGLAYQTLQTQGLLPPVSLHRGYLNGRWLKDLHKAVGQKVVNYWAMLLSRPVKHMPFDIDNLVIALLEHNENASLAHLRDNSLNAIRHPKESNRTYTHNEIKEIIHHMCANGDSLAEVFESEEGAVNTGHCLRQLGRYSVAALRDLVEKLETIQPDDIDRMLLIFGRLSQECALASADNKPESAYIKHPTDSDLKTLVRQIETFNATRIAFVLIALSWSRYDKNDGDGDGGENQIQARS